MSTFRRENMLGRWRTSSAVIDIEPRAAAAYNNRGFNYQQLGKHAEALSDFDRAIELAPDYALAYQNKAWLIVVSENDSLGNPSVAIAAATKAGELNNYGVISDLAALAAALGPMNNLKRPSGGRKRSWRWPPRSESPTPRKCRALSESQAFDPTLNEQPASDKDKKDK
ncbi:MAG: tetratricopeptide repeat protein [Pirellulaceae bacterium]